MAEYFDHFQATEPAHDVDEHGNHIYRSVYAAKQLPDGTWHCLLTAAQKDALGTYTPFSKAPKKCKGQGKQTITVDGVEMEIGFVKDAPVHVFGNRVQEVGKHYKPGSAEPIEDDQGEDEP